MIVVSALSVVYTSWRFFGDYQNNIYFQQGDFIRDPETMGFVVLAVALVVVTAIIVLRGRSPKPSASNEAPP